MRRALPVPAWPTLFPFLTQRLLPAAPSLLSSDVSPSLGQEPLPGSPSPLDFLHSSRGHWVCQGLVTGPCVTLCLEVLGVQGRERLAEP